MWQSFVQTEALNNSDICKVNCIVDFSKRVCSLHETSGPFAQLNWPSVSETARQIIWITWVTEKFDQKTAF